MKMQHTYGIYEGEIEPIVSAVRSHRPLLEIEAMSCPCCGAAIAVEFADDGSGFQVLCRGDPLHISQYQEIATPPPWWKERASEPSLITFYWREWSSVSDDGSLTMKVSGYDADGCHWSGVMQLRPDEPDYLLWRWIIGCGDLYKSLISDKDLEAVREDYHRMAAQGVALDRPRD